MPRQIALKDIPACVGQPLGSSDWFLVTQDGVNAFADATHDHQWIHVDVDRAKRESPFGGPIAHGYFTLSLVPYLLGTIWTVTGGSAGLNYGLNRMRFPAPVPVPSRIRAHATLESAEEVPGGIQVQVNVKIEVEGNAKPACAAEAIYRYYA